LDTFVISWFSSLFIYTLWNKFLISEKNFPPEYHYFTFEPRLIKNFKNTINGQDCQKVTTLNLLSLSRNRFQKKKTWWKKVSFFETWQVVLTLFLVFWMEIPKEQNIIIRAQNWFEVFVISNWTAISQYEEISFLISLVLKLLFVGFFKCQASSQCFRKNLDWIFWVNFPLDLEIFANPGFGKDYSFPGKFISKKRNFAS